MLKVILLLLSTVAVGVIIWIRNGHRKRFRERAWAIILLMVGTFMIVSQIVRIPVPNPLDAISAVYSPLYRPIVKWLEEGEPSS